MSGPTEGRPNHRTRGRSNIVQGPPTAALSSLTNAPSTVPESKLPTFSISPASLVTSDGGSIREVRTTSSTVSRSPVLHSPPRSHWTSKYAKCKARLNEPSACNSSRPVPAPQVPAYVRESGWRTRVGVATGDGALPHALASTRNNAQHRRADRMAGAILPSRTGPAGGAVREGPDTFGEPIHAYTRAQAIADGVLVDVTRQASPAEMHGGFTVPVAVTAALWSAIEAIPDSLAGIADARGRLHDVLWMASLAARRQGASFAFFAPFACTPQGIRAKFPPNSANLASSAIRDLGKAENRLHSPNLSKAPRCQDPPIPANNLASSEQDGGNVENGQETPIPSNAPRWQVPDDAANRENGQESAIPPKAPRCQVPGAGETLASTAPIQFALHLPYRGTRKRTQLLAVVIGPDDNGSPCVTIGFPEDF